VSDHPARRLWATLETIHDVVYFAPGVRDAGVGLGLRGFWMTYFAFRAAPLGAVGAEPVIACFAGFESGMVAKALPDAWSRTIPEACLDARRSVSVDALTAAGIDESSCAAGALEVDGTDNLIPAHHGAFAVHAGRHPCGCLPRARCAGPGSS
jgi:hypothetical protein